MKSQLHIVAFVKITSPLVMIELITTLFLAKGHKKSPEFPRGFGPTSWCQLESNQRHTDFQSVALPTELWHLMFAKEFAVLTMGRQM